MSRRSRMPPRVDRPEVRAVAEALLGQLGPAGTTPVVAGPADAPALAALSAACFGPTAITAAGWRRSLGRANALVLTLRAGPELRCHCLIEFNRSQRRAYVVETATAEAARGQGLALFLRGRLELFCVSVGYRHIASHVSVDNAAARALNRRAGMVEVGQMEGYYDDGGAAIDLRKTLAAAPGSPA